MFSTRSGYVAALVLCMSCTPRAFTLPTTADVKCIAARVALNSKHYDKAIALYNEVLRLAPATVMAYAGRGVAYYKQGDYDKATERAGAYLYKGAYDKALADSTKAIQLGPRTAEAYYIRAWANCAQGAYDEATADYHKAVRMGSKQMASR